MGAGLSKGPAYLSAYISYIGTAILSYSFFENFGSYGKLKSLGGDGEADRNFLTSIFRSTDRDRQSSECCVFKGQLADRLFEGSEDNAFEGKCLHIVSVKFLQRLKEL
jgi:hypothetical protein